MVYGACTKQGESTTAQHSVPEVHQKSRGNKLTAYAILKIFLCITNQSHSYCICRQPIKLAGQEKQWKMPHFIIECSENIIQQKSPDAIMQAVYDAAEATGLFAPNDIKVRLRPYQYFKLGKTKKISFTFSGISWKAEARNKEQIFLKK